MATSLTNARDLLAHRTGLPRHDLLWYASHFTREEIFDWLHYLEPSRTFRSTWQYQNMMYMVAGLLVTQITGTSWEHYVQTQIFDRLGMRLSNLSTVQTKQTTNFATPHQARDEQIHEIPFFEQDGEHDAVGPAGSINSCVQDMAEWLKVHLNNGHAHGKPFISTANLTEMHKPHMVIDNPDARRFGFTLNSYGLGWFMHGHKGRVLVHHGGNIDGFSSLTSFMPQENLGVVVLTNGNHNAIPAVVSFTIYDRLLGLDTTDWNELYKPFHDEIKAAHVTSKTHSGNKRRADAPLSHPLEDYLGEYEHLGYGVLSVEQDGEQLQMTLNKRFSLPLEHYHYDYFEGYFERFDLSFKASFTTDVRGNISQVAVQMEPNVKEIVFTRRPDPRLQDPAFLEPFTGIYNLMDKPMTVTLQQNALVLYLPGQPACPLVPYQDTEFQLQGLAGFSVAFQQDETGTVTEAIFNYPNATFVAKRQ
ncbi:MAG: serine hydrolase [Chloroflexota bacterium]